MNGRGKLRKKELSFFLIGIVGPRFPYIWKGDVTVDAESLCKRFPIRGNGGCVWN
jgi:hypothetical protein